MTPADCLSQLRCVGIGVELSEAGTLKLKAPDGIDLAPMLPVVKRNKPGIVRLLRDDMPVQSRRLGVPTGELPSSALAVVQQVRDIFGQAEVLSIKPRRTTQG